MQENQLHDLFGVVRDGVGAIRNLERLLESVRVSPKAVAVVLADVGAACPGIQRGLERFVLQCEDPGDPAGGPRALLDFVTPRLRALHIALEHRSQTLSASKRLSLERVVKSYAGELETALGLMEMLELAHAGTRSPLELVELLEQCRKGDQPGGIEGGQITVPVRFPHGNVTVAVNPRLVWGVIGVMAATLRANGVEQLCVDLSTSNRDCYVDLNGDKGVEPNGELVLNLPGIVPPSIPCALTCVRSSGGSVEFSQDRTGARITWPLLRAGTVALA